MGVIAKRDLKVFGRKVKAGDVLTEEEIAKWDSGKYQVTFQSHLNMGWVERTDEKAPQAKKPQAVKAKVTTKAGTEIHTKTKNAKGTPKPKAKPPVSQVA